jgi:hypothetical protein
VADPPPAGVREGTDIDQERASAWLLLRNRSRLPEPAAVSTTA